MNTVTIDSRDIGSGNPCFVIAEVAQAHDGSLGFAHSFIDAAAEAGVDAIKFQTHIASSESTKDETFRIPMSGQDVSRYDYWKRMEFTPEQWVGLKEHATDRGVVFLSSAFSVDAVHLLNKIGMPAWKIGSGEFKSNELLEAMMETGRPLLYSTGMSKYAEVDNIVQGLQSQRYPHCVFQCTSKYPTSLDNVGLNVLDEYRERYGCPIGLSDHSGTPFPALAAISRNVDLLELHVTFDKRLYGPDAVASVTFDEMSTICKMRDAVHVMNKNPVNKDHMAHELDTMRGLFTKSIAFKTGIKAGEVVTEQMLMPKKPGTGIPYTDKHKVVGRTLKVDVASDRLLKWEELV